jgi:hypothetical protein
VEITPLMSFKHLKMLNSASKCPKITLKVIKFSKPEEKNPKKIKFPHVKFMPGVNPPPTVYETLTGSPVQLQWFIMVDCLSFMHLKDRKGLNVTKCGTQKLEHFLIVPLFFRFNYFWWRKHIF